MTVPEHDVETEPSNGHLTAADWQRIADSVKEATDRLAKHRPAIRKAGLATENGRSSEPDEKD